MTPKRRVVSARAQQQGKLPTVGILGSNSAAWSHLVSALMQRLRELGYIENRTVAIEYRWTEGRNERYAAMAAELVGLKADIIVALGTPAILPTMFPQREYVETGGLISYGTSFPDLFRRAAEMVEKILR